MATRALASSADSIASPCGPDHGPQVLVRLADALDRDPAVGDPGPPGDGPLAARHDVGPEAQRPEPADHGRDVVGLDRVGAQPRIREGRRHRGGGSLQGPDIGDRDGGAEAMGGEPERRRYLGQAIHLAR